MLTILAAILFDVRELRDYSEAKVNFEGIDIKVKLAGTYRGGERNTLSNPYTLYVFFGDEIKSNDIEICSMRLFDQDGSKSIVKLQYPVLSIEKRNIGTGTLNYLKVKNLTLTYVDYWVTIVFKIKGEEKETTIKIPTKYEKKMVNPWWEKASGI